MDFVCIGANDAVKTLRKTSIGGARNRRRRKTSVLNVCANAIWHFRPNVKGALIEVTHFIKEGDLINDSLQ